MSASTLPALRNGHEIEVPPRSAPGFSLNDIQVMAETVARSGLFPSIKTPQAACALMLICQSEGIHPIKAMQRYHIIEGKPSKQANAMLDDFLKSGGRVQWGERTDLTVTATFSHPSGGELTVTWDMEQAKRAGLATKDNWRKYPRQMLTARVISEGVRTVYPAAVAGLYTPEEVQDFDDRPAIAVEPPQNNSGHGRGQYASPEQAKSYGVWLRDYLGKRNGDWAAWWVDRETGDPINGIPELCSTWQANGHLVKWAVDAGLLDGAILPEQTQARQRDNYPAVVYHRNEVDRKALVKELRRYVNEQIERKTEAIRRKFPNLAADYFQDAEEDAPQVPPVAAENVSDEDSEPFPDEPGMNG